MPEDHLVESTELPVHADPMLCCYTFRPLDSGLLCVMCLVWWKWWKSSNLNLKDRR